MAGGIFIGGIDVMPLAWIMVFGTECGGGIDSPTAS